MGQSDTSQLWDIIIKILTIPSLLIGTVTGLYVAQKGKLEKEKLGLEKEKIRLENRKLELEILEKENNLRGKKKLPSNLSSSGNNNGNTKSKSALQRILLDIESVENWFSNSLMKLLNPFQIVHGEKSVSKISGQQIIGSLVELIYFVLFIYADLTVVAKSLEMIFPTGASLPPFLAKSNIIVITSIFFTPQVIGFMIGELLGITSYTFWAVLRDKKKTFLPIMYFTFITSLVFGLLLAFSNPVLSATPIFTFSQSVSQSLIIIPTLITTALLQITITAKNFLVIFALPLILLRLPITFLRKIIARIVYYVSD